MIRGEISESIPTDLIIEILSRLPAKSIARFRCMSKLWGSMFISSYFTELFLTRSSARPPRLLFVVKEHDDCCFFTSPQPHNLYENSSSSLVVAAYCHLEYPNEMGPISCDFASGLIYFSQLLYNPILICNPSTREYVSLPLPKGEIDERIGNPMVTCNIFLGFDPIDKQYKVLFITRGEKKGSYHILTLGTGNDSWRKINCPLNHFPIDDWICINGVLYYLASQHYGLPCMIVCFDVKFETFKFIYIDFIGWYDSKLINYMGKLGVITLEAHDNDDIHCDGGCHFLELWVIKDFEKPESSEWSKYFSYSWDYEVVDGYLSIVGVTATGEIVLSCDSYELFSLLFLNPKKSTRQRVEIQGFDHTREVRVFLDYVEDLKFITMDDASPPQQKTTSNIII